MDFNAFRNYLLKKKGATESFPFGEDVAVFKVGTKMFSCCIINEKPLKANLKCDPLIAMELRDQYPAVKPGYHMNKRLWNTVEMDGSIPEDEILEMIDNSYELVFKGLNKSEREKIKN